MHWGRWSDTKMQICVNMKEVAHGALYAKHIYIKKTIPIHFLSALLLHSAALNCPGVKAERRPGRATSALQGHTKRRTFTLSYGQFRFLTWPNECLCTVGGSSRTQFETHWHGSFLFFFNVHFWNKKIRKITS